MRITYILFITSLFVSCSRIDIKKETINGLRQYKNDSLIESIKTFSKVIAANDTCRQCLLYRGFAYKDLNKYESALADFNSLIKIDDKAVGYANRASVYYIKNDYKSALRDFSIAYKLDSSTIFLNPICHMLFANGYKDSACIYYQKASSLGDTTFDSIIKEYCNDKQNYR